MSQEFQIGPAAPFLIVTNLTASLRHYVDRLGFACLFKAPEHAPFFALVALDAARLMLKEVGDDVAPRPNHLQHEWAPWDVFVFSSDPDLMAQQLGNRGVMFTEPLATRDDNLRGFAVADPDQYVCFFGKPLEEA